MQKGDHETRGQREAVLRVASDILSSNKSVQALELPLQTFVNVLVKASILAHHSARLERQVGIVVANACQRLRPSTCAPAR